MLLLVKMSYNSDPYDWGHKDGNCITFRLRVALVKVIVNLIRIFLKNKFLSLSYSSRRDENMENIKIPQFFFHAFTGPGKWWLLAQMTFKSHIVKKLWVLGENAIEITPPPLKLPQKYKESIKP